MKQGQMPVEKKMARPIETKAIIKIMANISKRNIRRKQAALKVRINGVEIPPEEWSKRLPKVLIEQLKEEGYKIP